MIHHDRLRILYVRTANMMADMTLRQSLILVLI